MFVAPRPRMALLSMMEAGRQAGLYLEAKITRGRGWRSRHRRDDGSQWAWIGMDAQVHGRAIRYELIHAAKYLTGYRTREEA